MKSTSTISKLETGAICIYYVLLFLLSPQMWQSKRHLHIRFNNENQQSSKLFVRSLPLLVLLLLTLNLRYCFLKLKSTKLPVSMQRCNIIILCLTNFLKNKIIIIMFYSNFASSFSFYNVCITSKLQSCLFTYCNEKLSIFCKF